LLPLQPHSHAIYPVIHLSENQNMVWITGVQFPAGGRDFCICHHVWTGSDAHSSSYSVGSRGCFAGCRVAKAWRADHLSPSSADVNMWS